MICKWLRKLCIDKSIDWGNITSSEIDKWYESGSPLHELFTRHTVTFFDDFDVNMLKDHKAKDILTAMDGMEDTFHRIRIFTANDVMDNVDVAFFRPGRIDATFTIKPPNREMRKQLVNHAWPIAIQEHINEPGRMAVFLERTEGFSFAELEAIRGIMVKMRVMDGEAWNQDKAFRVFGQSRYQKRKVGF